MKTATHKDKRKNFMTARAGRENIADVPRPRPVEPNNGILFSISNHGGQFQFWHSWCEGDKAGSPMNLIGAEGTLKKFKCIHCNRVGQADLASFQVGKGVLFEITNK